MYMFGLSRNTWFAIGGVMLAVVLYLGFSGGDDAASGDDDKVVRKSKGKGKGKGKGKRAGGSGGERGGMGIGKVCARLECSETQLSSFRTLVKGHRTETKTQRRSLAEAHAKIAAELAEDTLNSAALDEAFAAVATERSAIDASARRVLETMHAQLSWTQRETLAKLVARHGPTLLLARPTPGSSKKGRGKGKGKGKGRRKKKGKRKKGHKGGTRTTPEAGTPAEGTEPADSPEAPEGAAEAKAPPAGDSDG
jgi:uncharacterized membrane protein